MARTQTLGGVLLALGVAAAVVSRSSIDVDGVAVVSADAEGAPARAGIRPGDVLAAWAPAGTADRRAIRDGFDLAEVEIEEAPRGAVRLIGRRGEAPLSVTLDDGEWELRVRAVRTAPEDWRARCAGRLEQAERLAREKKRDAAAAAFTEARGLARQAKDRAVEALCLDAEGRAWTDINDLPRAEAAFRDALALRRALAGERRTLALALAQSRLANVRAREWKLDEAEALWRESLEIRRRLAPDRVVVSNVLFSLGAMRLVRGDLAAAEELTMQALAIRERRIPGTYVTARTLANLGQIARRKGDLVAAEASYRRYLAACEARGEDLTHALLHLAVLALDRGDWDGAEAYLRRAIGSGGGGRRDDVLANCHQLLGRVYQARGLWSDAETHYRRSLELYRSVEPGAPVAAATVFDLGNLALARGEREAAQRLMQESLDDLRRGAPGSLFVARSLDGLGRLHDESGRPEEARRLHAEALAIRRGLAPGSFVEAESLHAIGAVARRQGRHREAREHWTAAIDVLERQRGRSTRSGEIDGPFGARYTPFYRDLVDLLVETGATDEAFTVLERARARSLIALLAERDLVADAESLPPDLAEAQRRLHAESDAVQEKLARRRAGDAEAASLRAQVVDLQERRTLLAAEIRRRSPRFASLRYPEALSPETARAALGPGTALLSYCVGRERTFVFVLSAETPQTFVATIPIGADAMRHRVSTFLAMIDRGRQSPVLEAALVRQARALFEDLVGPVRAAVADRTRLLVCPDGPLHALPFAALLESDSPRRFLAEWKPVHKALSATTYAEIERLAPAAAAPAGLALAAFGDPATGTGGAEDASDRFSIVARARRLPPLPASREEVDAVAALFPGTAAVRVGAEATEEEALALLRTSRYVHFACHGLVDERFPLNSALALAPSRDARRGGGNGVLQAWEIFERGRTHAELVTLSACESGLGREMDGEGLLGLARAFQYAGARTVLATLWPVGDRMSAELMRRFYTRLRDGAAKDVALRDAQMELAHGLAPHPFHWAAFELTGRPD